ncbi:MAG: glycosyltransferase family A protein [Alphaproteobacteria bacterium]
MTVPPDGVSFVVPVYNKAPWLPAVLTALGNQRGGFAREFIFIDDGSSDDSLAILRDLTRDWDDTTVITQDNRGSAHATNRGIEAARHPFIKFCDADDLLTRDGTHLLLEALSASDACLAYGNRKTYVDLAGIDAGTDLDPPAETAPETAKVTVMAAPMRAALRNSLFNPSQLLVRSESVRAVGGCDERIVYSQEYSLTLRLARRWPFLKLNQLVALVLGEGPGRLSGNMARQLQRVTLACANFLEDCPDIGPGLRHFACRRAAGRAWKWRRRIHGAGLASPWFWRNLGSYMPLDRDAPAFIRACARAFDGGDAL